MLLKDELLKRSSSNWIRWFWSTWFALIFLVRDLLPWLVDIRGGDVNSGYLVHFLWRIIQFLSWLVVELDEKLLPVLILFQILAEPLLVSSLEVFHSTLHFEINLLCFLQVSLNDIKVYDCSSAHTDQDGPIIFTFLLSSFKHRNDFVNFGKHSISTIDPLELLELSQSRLNTSETLVKGFSWVLEFVLIELLDGSNQAWWFLVFQLYQLEWGFNVLIC